MKTSPNRGEGVLELIVTIAFWGLIFWGVTSLFGDHSSSNSSGYSSGGYYDDYGYEEEEYYSEPENPDSSGTGHSAGFEWAEENDVDSCDGNSQSFIEGCEEYIEQRDEYEYQEYQDEYDEYYDRY